MKTPAPIDTPNLFLDRRRTIPWGDDELLVAAGMRLVYTADRGGIIGAVHLPGGRRTTIGELLDAGCEVRLPRRVRVAERPRSAGDVTKSDEQ